MDQLIKLVNGLARLTTEEYAFIRGWIDQWEQYGESTDTCINEYELGKQFANCKYQSTIGMI